MLGKEVQTWAWTPQRGRESEDEGSTGDSTKACDRQNISSQSIKAFDRRTAGPMEPCIWQYAFGKPKDSIDLNWDLTKLSDEELDQLGALLKRVA